MQERPLQIICNIGLYVSLTGVLCGFFAKTPVFSIDIGIFLLYNTLA